MYPQAEFERCVKIELYTACRLDHSATTAVRQSFSLFSMLPKIKQNLSKIRKIETKSTKIDCLLIYRLLDNLRQEEMFEAVRNIFLPFLRKNVLLETAFL